ncbi:hypothetical protein [Streptomyces eurythermus]|uniref:hypothetical protein n=1 Tax=Streptomyces eurythermus TaxID=42237 RepID=UPI0036F53716
MVTVGWTFVQAASRNPDIIDLPANSVQPSGVLKAAGAQSATAPCGPWAWWRVRRSCWAPRCSR